MSYMDTIIFIARQERGLLVDCLIRAAAEGYDTPVDYVRQDVVRERLRMSCHHIKWNHDWRRTTAYDEEKDEI